MLNALKKALLVLVLFYFAFLLFLYINQRDFLYHPDPKAPDTAILRGVDFETVTVKTSDGIDLNGWYIPAKGEKQTLVVFHGNSGNFGDRVGKLSEYVERGYGVLFTEYRGFAGNSGSPSEQGLYKDARAFMAYIGDKQIDDIVIYGESIGTGVAVKMAHENARMAKGSHKNDIKAVVLEAGYSAMSDIAASHYPVFPVKLLLKDKFDARAYIADIQVPLLMVHGSHDTIIPIEVARQLFDAAQQPKTFLEREGAGHNNLYAHGALEGVLEFIEGL